MAARRRRGEEEEEQGPTGLERGLAAARSPLPARPAPPAYPDDATAAAYALARAPASFAATLHALLALRASGALRGPLGARRRRPRPFGRRRRRRRFGSSTSGQGRAPPSSPPPRLSAGAASRSWPWRGLEAMASAGRRVVESLREAAAAAADELEISDDDDGSESGSEERRRRAAALLPAAPRPLGPLA